MAMGLAMFTLSATAEEPGHGYPGEAADTRFVEISRTVAGDDGLLRELTVWVDSEAIDPEAAIAALMPNVEAQPDVSAAYAANKRWSAADIPVEVRYNAAYDPPGIDGASVAAWAMDQWNQATGQSFSWMNGGSTDVFVTSNCSQNEPDTVNTVRFSALLDGGVLGLTCTIFTGPPGEISRMIEFDMQLSTKINWSTDTPTPGNRYDLYTVMLHEFGHALGLGHSHSGTVMQPLLGYGEQMRVLQTDDLDGLRFLYGSSSGPTATATPTRTPSPSPTRVPRPQVDHPYKLFAAQAAVADSASTPPPASTPTSPVPSATPTKTPSPTPTPALNDKVITRNATWVTSTLTGSIYVMGEVYNGSDSTVEFVEITANFYAADGTLLATELGGADITTIPSGADSPFWIILSNPPAGVQTIGLTVSDYSDDPFFPVVTGLTVTVSDVYTDGSDVLHIVGSVTNSSATSWDYVQPIVALYNNEGLVIETDYTFTDPGTLDPGETGSFELLIANGASLDEAPLRFWVEAIDF